MKLFENYVTVNELTTSVSGISDINSRSSKDIPAQGTANEQDDKRQRLTVDFDALSGINSDIAGWIYIEGTPVNYPLTQTTDNAYYLRRSFEKERSRLGTIFLDCDLSINESDVLILYGHTISNQSGDMFAPLSAYDDPDFLHNHNEILLYTTDGSETTWNVFAVLHISVTQQDIYELYRKQNFLDESQFDAYIELIKSKQLFDTGITPVPNQRILMLSTCVGNLFGARRSDMRRLVFAAEVGH